MEARFVPLVSLWVRLSVQTWQVSWVFASAGIWEAAQRLGIKVQGHYFIY
jgi:hypothetical protein